MAPFLGSFWTPGVRSVDGRLGLGSPFSSLPLVPSYHVSVTGGRSPCAGNSYRIVVQSGADSGWGGGPSASTLLGFPRSSAQKAGSIRWHAMSPSAPVPKSHHPRHLKG